MIGWKKNFHNGCKIILTPKDFTLHSESVLKYDVAILVLFQWWK